MISTEQFAREHGNICDLISTMSVITPKNILFINACSCCNSISSTFRQRKRVILKGISPSEELQEFSLLFYGNEKQTMLKSFMLLVVNRMII